MSRDSVAGYAERVGKKTALSVREREQQLIDAMNKKIDGLDSKKYSMANKETQKQMRAEAYTFPLEIWGAGE